MNEYGVVTDASTICFERIFPGPIERVWAYLTDSEKRGQWLATGEMDLSVDGRVELHFRHADLSSHAEKVPDKYRQCENGVSFDGRVTRCEPPRLLSYTWGGEPGEESEVTFELMPRDNKVLLVLAHRRLHDRAAMVSVAGGWHTHLAVLADHLEGREPRPFWVDARAGGRRVREADRGWLTPGRTRILGHLRARSDHTRRAPRLSSR